MFGLFSKHKVAPAPYKQETTPTCPAKQYCQDIINIKCSPAHFVNNNQGNAFVNFQSPWDSNELILNDPNMRKLAMQSSSDKKITEVYTFNTGNAVY